MHKQMVQGDLKGCDADECKQQKSSRMTRWMQLTTKWNNLRDPCAPPLPIALVRCVQQCCNSVHEGWLAISHHPPIKEFPLCL